MNCLRLHDCDEGSEHITYHSPGTSFPIDMFPLKRLLNDDSNEPSSQGVNEEQLIRNELYKSFPAQR